MSPERVQEVNRIADRCRSGEERCDHHQRMALLADDVTPDDVVRIARRLVTHYLLSPGVRFRLPDGTRDQEAERLMSALIKAVD